jgi:branched-chain amino acid transport system permease protein
MKLGTKQFIGIGLAIILGVLPIFIDTYLMHIFIQIFFFTYLSCSWNIIGGFVGQLSLGHALFFGIGAYTSTILFVRMGISPWIGMFAGGALSAATAYLIGQFIFRYRIRGVFFSMVTLAFAEIAGIVAGQIRFLGGSEGILIPLKKTSFWTYQFADKEPYYYTILIMMLLVLWVSYLLKNSKYYSYFAAIRADEEAANALGVNAKKYKTMALCISGFFTALVGTFFAQYYMFIEPLTTFGVMVSVDMIIRPIIGGVGTVLGPVIGSFIMTPLGEGIRTIVGSGRSGAHLFIYGGALVAICIWMPRGILPYLSRWFQTK